MSQAIISIVVAIASAIANLTGARKLRSMAAVRREVKARWVEIVEAAVTAGAHKAPLARLPEKAGSIKLLGSNTKMIKSGKHKFVSRILGLAPHKRSGLNLCAWAGLCVAICLGFTSGRNVMSGAQNAQLWRTVLLAGAPALFAELLYLELRAFARSCKRNDIKGTARLDGLSDIGLAAIYAPLFPELLFLDYTKSPERAASVKAPNRVVALSADGLRNWSDIKAHLDSGGLAAMAFATGGAGLPASYQGYDCVNGDKHDLLNLHREQGQIVALDYKGYVRNNGFAVAI